MNHSNPLEHNLVAFSTFLGAAITPPIPRTSHHSKLKHCLSPHPTPVTLCVHLLTLQGPPPPRSHCQAPGTSRSLLAPRPSPGTEQGLSPSLRNAVDCIYLRLIFGRCFTYKGGGLLFVPGSVCRYSDHGSPSQPAPEPRTRSRGTALPGLPWVLPVSSLQARASGTRGGVGVPWLLPGGRCRALRASSRLRGPPTWLQRHRGPRAAVSRTPGLLSPAEPPTLALARHQPRQLEALGGLPSCCRGSSGFWSRPDQWLCPELSHPIQQAAPSSLSLMPTPANLNFGRCLLQSVSGSLLPETLRLLSIYLSRARSFAETPAVDLQPTEAHS